MAAFKTEMSIALHADMTIATDLEEFPTLTYRQAAVYAKFSPHGIGFLTVLTNS